MKRKHVAISSSSHNIMTIFKNTKSLNNTVTEASSKRADDGKDLSQYKVRELTPPVIAVFDNKTYKDITHRPRLSIVRNGVAIPITQGTSSALTAQDLESVSIADKEKGIYVATSSLGETHVFSLHVEGAATFVATEVATGQLPVPENESTESYEDANRTNIEAARVIFPSAENADDAGPIMVWGGRGGENYGGEETKSFVWLRSAPFDVMTGSVDKEKIAETKLNNIAPDDKWRTLSALDVCGDYLYFTSAYDGEEDGHAVDEADIARSGDANKAAFRSLIARTNLTTGAAEILLRLDGVKLEAFTVYDAKGDDGKVHCITASDDEGLGSLIGKVTFGPDGDGKNFGPIAPIEFIDIAGASEFYDVERKRYGTSGIAILVPVTKK